MKKITLNLVASLLAGCTLFSSFSRAEGPGNHHGQNWQHQNAGDHRQRAPGRGNSKPHDHAPGHRSAYREHFAWHGHDFRRGRPAPKEFRGNHYRVDNWRDRGLRAPGRGEHWAFIDGNYVLIAAATGIITSILLNNAFAD